MWVSAKHFAGPLLTVPSISPGGTPTYYDAIHIAQASSRTYKLADKSRLEVEPNMDNFRLSLSTVAKVYLEVGHIFYINHFALKSCYTADQTGLNKAQSGKSFFF